MSERIYGRLVGEGPPPPEANQSPETNPQPKSLEERLAESRIDFLTAKHRLNDLNKVRGFFASAEKKHNTESEYAQAQTKYKEARAEYIGTDVERFLLERELLINIELEEYDKKGNGLPRKIINGYKKLGEFNLLAGMEKMGMEVENKFTKTALRSINIRTGLSLGLLGLGVTFGAGTAVGIGAIAGRRGLSGLGSAIGSFDITHALRGNYNRSNIEKKLAGPLDPLEAEKMMTQMQVQGALGGKKLDEIREDELYKKLQFEYFQELKKQTENVESNSKFLELQIKQLEKEAAADGTTNQLKDNPEYTALIAELAIKKEGAIKGYFDEAHSVSTKNLDKTTSNEKLKRRLIAAVSTGIGLIVGSGALAKLFGHKTELGGNQPPSPPATAADEVLKSRPINKIVPMPDGNAGNMNPEIEKPLPSRSLSELKLTTPEAEELGNLHPGNKALDALAAKDIPNYSKPFELKPEVAPDTIVQAGKRGLEGALLDLKSTQPEQYEKMIKWLQEQPYNKGITKPGALVHRFMEDYAKAHDMTVDGGGKDLSRIFKGEIHINSEGEISMGSDQVDFMPEKASPTADAETPEPGPKTPIESHPVNIETSEIDVEEVDTTRPKIDHTGVSTAREIASDSVEKASHALQLVLDSEYKGFLKQNFKLSPNNFDKIANKSINEFLNIYREGSETFKSRYSGLFKSMSEELKTHGSRKTIRQFVLAAAKNYKQLK